MEHLITAVEPKSPAARCGIEPGDSVVAINGKAARDIIDYTYLTSQAVLTLTVRDHRSGETAGVRIKKRPETGLGLSFENYLMSRQRRCANSCVFCFEDQVPHCARGTLRSKDDDWRLSFVMGNFVTLTNVGKNELQRIIELHASPLYISVHALGQLRVDMMRNKGAGDILEKLELLSGGGISFHCQIVLCPGFNDGVRLDETLEALHGLKGALSAAVVPVGLTGFREGLTQLRPLTKREAGDAISQIEKYPGFAFASDEMYVHAGRELPPYEAYGEFCQIENGVGLIRKFERELDEALADTPEGCARGKRYLMATGEAAMGWLEGVAKKLSAHTGAELEVKAVRNDYFGGFIDVAGLVTGGDIAKQLAGADFGDGLIIPRTMLRAEGDVFLDDTTPGWLGERLGAKIYPVYADGGALPEFLSGK